MGVLIDISDRLTLLRRARRIASDVRRMQLRMAIQLVRIAEEEVQRQMLVLCDEDADKAEVEEAIILMPLLTEMLIKRRNNLMLLEMEFQDVPNCITIDD